MITKTKRRLLSSTKPTTTTNTTSDRQPPTSSNAHEKNITETQSRDEGELPVELISLVIRHLSGHQKGLYQCALVSKLFYTIANPYLWQVLNLRTNVHSERFLACMNDTPHQRFETLAHPIRQLHLTGIHWTDALLTHLPSYIPLLSHLSLLSCPNITDTSFQHLLRQCRHLTSLTLGYSLLTDTSFVAIRRHCPHLCDFEWHISWGLSAEWLILLQGCPLARLRLLSNADLLNDNTITTLQSFDHLTCLDLTDTTPARMRDLLFLAPPPTNTAFDRRIRRNATTATTTLWPRLKKLALDPCKMMDDATLAAFLKSHPHLQDITLMQVWPLTGATLDIMAEWLPSLARLHLDDNRHITSIDVWRLVYQCRACLSYVKMHHCTHVLEKDFPGLLNPKRSHGQPKLLPTLVWAPSVELEHWALDMIRYGIRE